MPARREVTGVPYAAEHALDLEAAGQVRAQLLALGDEPAQVDDLLDAGGRRATGEVVSANQIQVLKRPLRETCRRHHRVHQVDGVVGAFQRVLGVEQREQVAAQPTDRGSCPFRPSPDCG